jgi:hypothetical protein
MAGYTHGHNEMQTVVCHFTVGQDSTGIGERGYFTFLIRRNGEVVQFCEIDALCWHAGDWNGTGPGIEVEFLPGVDDQIFTDAARDACAKLVLWINASWGINLDYYDGERTPMPHLGFIAHRSLAAPGADHTDFWPREDWDQMISGSTKTKESDMVMVVGKTQFGVAIAFLVSGGRVLRTFTAAEGAYGIPQDALDWKAQSGRDAVQYVFVDQTEVNALIDPWPVVAGGASGLAVITDADVAKIAARVADVFNERLKT